MTRTVEKEYDNILHSPIVQDIIDEKAFFNAYMTDNHLFYVVYKPSDDVVTNIWFLEQDEENVLACIVLYDYKDDYLRILEVSDLLLGEYEYVEIHYKENGVRKMDYCNNKCK